MSLTSIQYKVLSVINEYQPVTYRNLKILLDVENSSFVTHHVCNLATLGYVKKTKRIKLDDDVIVRCTAEGLEALLAFNEQSKKIKHTLVFYKGTCKECGTFSRKLTRIKGSLLCESCLVPDLENDYSAWRTRSSISFCSEP